MKTADKILLISLDLFNSQGERNITSVDIANELDISPGNLYYHYKGKDDIINALVDRYVAKINDIPQSSGNNEDFYKYLFYCLDTMYLFRFLFQNIAEISAQYPAINTKLHRLAKFQRQYLRKCLCEQQQDGTLIGKDADIDLLLDIISLTMFQSLNYYQMQGLSLSNPDIVYRTLMTIYFSLQPYYQENSQTAKIKSAIINKTLIRPDSA
ncbi:TetR/AcrR family transcriptional regulator [Glaciecola sp. SC05]|uniref:TetR/AcrR family transcriptional regulator n=1 Tax=Glaciecola sp. SC05 TaxID=1987355 RepID=UPI00352812D6